MELCASRHHQDVVARFYSTFHHTDINDNALVAVIVGVKNQRLKRSIRVAFWSRNIGYDAFQNFLYIKTGFSGNARSIQCRDTDDVLDLVADHLWVCAWQVNLVDYRNNLQVMLDGKIGVCQSLCFNTLGSIHNQQRTFAGSQRTGYLVVKVDMSRGVDEVKFIGVPIFCFVFNLNGAGFDGDAAFPFQVHVVQKLIFHFTQGDRLCLFQNSVGKGRLAVVNVGNDAEISNVVLPLVCHEISPFYYKKSYLPKNREIPHNNLLYHKFCM